MNHLKLRIHDNVMVAEFYVTRNQKPFFYVSSAKEVSDAILQTYSRKGNTPQIELKTLTHNTNQKALTVTTNYNTLKPCGNNWIFINT